MEVSGNPIRIELNSPTVSSSVFPSYFTTALCMLWTSRSACRIPEVPSATLQPDLNSDLESLSRSDLWHI